MRERSALLAHYQGLTAEVVRLVEQRDWLALATAMADRSEVERGLLEVLAEQAPSELERRQLQDCLESLVPLLPMMEQARAALEAEQQALNAEQQGIDRVNRNLNRIGAAYR